MRGHSRPYPQKKAHAPLREGKVREKALRMSTPSTENRRNTVQNSVNPRDISPLQMSTPPAFDFHADLARILGTAPPATPAGFADDPRLAALLALHHLRELPPRILDRLDELMRSNPPDILDRLERAAEHLHLTGTNATALLDRATTAKDTPS